jgi:hypothetical protein
MRALLEARVPGVARRIADVAFVLSTLLGPRTTHADERIARDPEMAAGRRDLPKRLTIAVVTGESTLPTFEQRVSSWFADGTAVTVVLTTNVDPAALLDASSEEVRVWVVPMPGERALVTFSSADPAASARHLVREVSLPNGLDDLGLERLASVIHTAFLALREGADGFPRAQAEQELSAAGLPPSLPPEDMPRATKPPPDLAPFLRSRLETRGREPVEARAIEPRASLLLNAGYGARLRGTEGPGHGPTVGLGVQLPRALHAPTLLLGAQFLFRSRFEAGSVDASVQTSTFRALAGIEPELSPVLSLAALVGGGVDVAQIHPIRDEDGDIEPRPAGAQWRGAGEVSGGLWWRLKTLDLGALVHATFFFGDVHYGVHTNGGEQRLATPWAVQPALSLQGRFRSAW